MTRPQTAACMLFFVACILQAAFCSAKTAQAEHVTAYPANDPVQAVLNDAVKEHPALAGVVSTAHPQPTPATTGSDNDDTDAMQLLDDEDRQKLDEQKREFDQNLKNRETDAVITHKVYYWQYGSTMVIFGVVIAIVGVGLWMSFLHFQTAQGAAHHAVRVARERSERWNEVFKLVTSGQELSDQQMQLLTKMSPTDDKAEAIAFEASLTSVKMSSSLIGVIVLAISLAFFLAYVTIVYPVHDNSQQAAGPVQKPTSGE